MIEKIQELKEYNNFPEYVMIYISSKINVPFNKLGKYGDIFCTIGNVKLMDISKHFIEYNINFVIYYNYVYYKIDVINGIIIRRDAENKLSKDLLDHIKLNDDIINTYNLMQSI